MTANSYDRQAVTDIVASFGARPEMLIQILHGVMAQVGWIPDAVVRQLADELNLSRAEVHGVVSYYHDFRTEPAGRHVVKICQAESCQAMGSRELTAHAKSSLGLDLHQTADEITLDPVYCLGNCACSPNVMIDDKTYGRVTPERFDALIAALRELS
jgi:formate dehydrogenase subunit gamma